jgi:hypothetical protein
MLKTIFINIWTSSICHSRYGWVVMLFVEMGKVVPIQPGPEPWPKTFPRRDRDQKLLVPLMSSCLAHNALSSNLGTTRHRIIFNKSLTAVCLGSSGQCILVTCDIHRPLWLVSAYGELKWLSGGTLRQGDLLSRATASIGCRKNIGLSKLCPDSTLYRKAVYFFFLSPNTCLRFLVQVLSDLMKLMTPSCQGMDANILIHENHEFSFFLLLLQNPLVFLVYNFFTYTIR